MIKKEVVVLDECLKGLLDGKWLGGRSHVENKEQKREMVDMTGLSNGMAL